MINKLLITSYLSLYLAEVILAKIETNLNEELKKQGIDCHYEYFSDDFYFFCNNSDVEKIKEIFSNVLNSYELEINYEKIAIFDFEEYNQLIFCRSNFYTRTHYSTFVRIVKLFANPIPKYL